MEISHFYASIICAKAICQQKQDTNSFSLKCILVKMVPNCFIQKEEGPFKHVYQPLFAYEH